MTLFKDANLKLWYPMTKGSGTTLYDYGVDANNGTFTGDPTWEKEKTGQYYLVFDGGDGISLTAIDLDNSFSLCCWVNASDNGFIIAKDSGSSGGDIEYSLSVWDYGTPYFHLEMGNTVNTQFRASSTTSPTQGTWYHVVGTFNSSTGVMNIYVNGLYEGTDTFTGTRSTKTSGTYIGRRANGVYLIGSLQNPMIFEKELSANEIKDLYNKTFIE